MDVLTLNDVPTSATDTALGSGITYRPSADLRSWLPITTDGMFTRVNSLDQIPSPSRLRTGEVYLVTTDPANTTPDKSTKGFYMAEGTNNGEPATSIEKLR